MAREYSSVAVQIGAEATKGVAVPADKQLMGLRLDADPNGEFVTHRPSGFWVPTQSSQVTELTEGDAEGPMDFNSLAYPLSSVFGKTTPTVGEDGDVTWVWDVAGHGSVDPQSYTIEVGDAQGANRFDYAVFTGLDFDIARTGENTFSSAVIGRALDNAATMTASPDQIDIVPINGNMWDVYAADAHGNLGSNKLLNLYDASMSFSDMFEQDWTINSENASYNSLFLAEEPSFEWSMTLGVDAVANAYFEKARSGGKKFFRIEANGPAIAAGTNYKLTIDFAAIVTDFDSFQSADGRYALPMSFSVAYDSVWGQAMKITLVNTVESL